MSRNRRIALDFAAGVPAAEIATREDISLPRVYQIVEKICKSVGLAPKTASKEELGLLLTRAPVDLVWHDVPNNPFDFYWTTLQPNRVKEVFDHPDEKFYPL